MGDVRFKNSYSAVISVAYMRFDHACGTDCGDPWDVLGWVNLAPGETQTRPNPTGNQFFYYYAEGADGSTWSGNFSAEVKLEVFEKCTCLGTTSPLWFSVGMKELDLSQHGGVNFIPHPAAPAAS
jgi:Protein of unknown function (DUF1036)